MKHLYMKSLAVVAFAAIALNANADNGRLFIIGNATPYGYSLDDAQALLANTDEPAVFTGTIYLKANEEFKFMEAHEWGSTEYGVADVTPVAGSGIELKSGKNDEGYSKITVAEAGNYYMMIDTRNLTATIEKSAYQDTEVQYCSLFLIGGATDGGWSVESGTPLYQSKESPYIYSNGSATLKAAPESFKIARTLKGGGTFDSKYYYFKDSADDAKISTDGTDDRQWSVSAAGSYKIIVNTVDSSITIDSSAGVENVEASGAALIPVYYNLQGQKVANPEKGIYIKVTGNRAEKIVF